MCSAGSGCCACVCVLGCAQVCKSVRAGTGRWDPCDSQPGLGVTWILCVALRRKENRYRMSFCCESASNDAFEFLSPIFSFLSSIVSLCVPSSLSVALYHPSSYFQRNNILSCFFFSSCLGGSFLSSVVCRGSMERHLLAPRQIPDYVPQLRL